MITPHTSRVGLGTWAIGGPGWRGGWVSAAGLPYNYSHSIEPVALESTANELLNTNVGLSWVVFKK